LVRKGLSEAEVQAALGDLDHAALPGRTVAALRLADCLAGPHPRVDDALIADLRRHFDEGEILELGAALTVASGWQRFIEAFGIRPDGWTEATPLPWLGRSEPTR
jgi:alkylhydroperoxidase family enzyme